MTKKYSKFINILKDFVFISCYTNQPQYSNQYLVLMLWLIGVYVDNVLLCYLTVILFLSSVK